MCTSALRSCRAKLVLEYSYFELKYVVYLIIMLVSLPGSTRGLEVKAVLLMIRMLHRRPAEMYGVRTPAFMTVK